MVLLRHCIFSTLSANSPSTPAPIFAMPKPVIRVRKKARNVFYDNRGVPDESNTYDHLLHNIDGRVILCKKKFDAPALDKDDLEFNYVFSKANHGNRLTKELDLSHLLPEQGTKLATLIKRYWCVFNDRGTFVPVRNYQCIIDTGNAIPITIKKIHYSPREIPIMRCSIAVLEKVG
jgi:hypothetical protein